MPHTGVIDRNVQSTRIWLAEVADELGIEDRRQADRVLRAVPHTETEGSYAVAAVTRVLQRHVSSGELEDVRAMMPMEL